MAGVVAAGATAGMTAVTGHQLTAQPNDVVPYQAAPARIVDDFGLPRFPGLPPVTDLQDLTVALPDERSAAAGSAAAQADHQLVRGIPARVLAAYRNATGALAQSQPGCGLSLPLLAAIGRVESGHARGGQVDVTGRTLTPILGPRLDGSPGVRAIHDSDNGAYDRDIVWDRAVGPMQFIPSTWQRRGADGNGDGVADPHNVDDAALAAGGYLCSAGGDLNKREGVRRAVLAYNNSEHYLNLVLAWTRAYAGNTFAIPGSKPESGAKWSSSRSAKERPPEQEEQGEEQQSPGQEEQSPGPEAPPEPPAPSLPEQPHPPEDIVPSSGPVTAPVSTSVALSGHGR